MRAQALGPGRRVRTLQAFRDPQLRGALPFLAPWLVGMVVFTVGPMVASFALSLTDYDAIPMTPDRFVGLANYERLVADPRAWTAMSNTVFFTVLYVPLSMALALGLALLLSGVRRGSGILRTIFYLPNVAPAVAVGALFLLLLNGRSGLVNQALGAVGITGPSWLNDPAWIKPGIVLMMLWSIGGTIVIYFAALRNVPRELYEAAWVDGADARARFRHVTLPMISGALFFTLIINTIASLQLFSEVYAMFFGRQTAGASEQSALFYVIYVFRNAFEFQRMGYAAALSWLLFLVIAIITAVQVRTSRRWVFYQGGDT